MTHMRHKHLIKGFAEYMTLCNREHKQKQFENRIIIGDFNVEEKETNIKDFLIKFNMVNMVKEPTCYKNLIQPSCIDLIITNNNNNH